MATADHARPRAFFEIVDGSLRHYRQRFGALLVLFVPAGIAQLVVGLTSGVIQAQSFRDPAELDPVGFAGTMGLAMIGWLVWTVVYLIGYGASVFLVSRDLEGRPVEGREAWSLSTGRFWAMIGLGILFVMGWSAIVLLAVVTLGVLFLLVIPGLWATIRLFLSYQTLLLENLNVGDAMARSWELMEGNFWRGVGLLVFLWVLVTVVTAPASLVGAGWIFFVNDEGEIGNPAGFWGFLAIGQLLGTAVQLVTAPLASLVYTHFYRDVRVRREGLDLRQRLERVGGTEPPSPPSR